MPEPDGQNCRAQSSARFTIAAVFALGVSSVVTQLALLREMLCAFSGNELVLGIILGNWLLLTGLGSWLGRLGDRLRNPAGLLPVLLIVVAVLPLAQVFLLRTLRDVIFIRGAMIGITETVMSSLVLLLPYCLASGFLLTLACTVLTATEESAETACSNRRQIGRVYVADSLGGIVGGGLFSFVLIKWLDHFGILCIPALLTLALVAGAGFYFGRKILAGSAALLLAGLVTLIVCMDLDDFSTALQFSKQKVVFRANSPYGRLVVTESAGQFNFIENGLPFISTHNLEQIEETVHYAMVQRPDAQKVLLVGGGVSGTAREILKYGISEVTYVEMDPLIIAAGRRYLPETLADARIRVVNTDGRLFIKQTAEHYDVVIVDLPDPSTSQLNRFYTAEFFAEVKRILADDGVLCFPLGRYENYVSPQLARLLASADQTLKTCFKNVLLIPGGRVFFLAADGELHRDIATRIEANHIPTQLVQRHYLDAMLTADRLADLQRALAQPALVNRDFSPVLYNYHLLYWISQFKVRFGLLEGALFVLLAVYLVTLRAVSLAVFVGGFAAAALEVVLLVGFQILYGSLYQQLGVIITLFMAGLALGALIGNRLATESGRGRLAALALAIAAYSALLPMALLRLGQAGSSPAALFTVQAAIALFTLLLALLIGLEFSLAGQLRLAVVSLTASRLYTADFVGAALGALLASTLLIPVLGMTATCLLTAGLNLLGGIIVLSRKT